LDGTFVLRACIINPWTTPEDLECLVALVRDLGVQRAGGGVGCRAHWMVEGMAWQGTCAWPLAAGHGG
jgi:hypothetical protein